MSDEMTKDGTTETQVSDRVYLRRLVHRVADELNAIMEERQGALDEEDLLRVTDRVCAGVKAKSPLENKPIGQLSMDDLQLAFSIAALRAAEENATLATDS